MSKAIDRLLPEDFGKSFDMEMFHAWKKSAGEHEQAGITVMILYITGIVAMLLLGGLVGVGLFFILGFIGMGIALPKQKKRKKYQQQLGINNTDVRNAVIQSKKRTN